LLNLLNNKRYCDVTFHFADNQKIDAHKIVLAARSVPFRRILLRIKNITEQQEIRRITQEIIGEYKHKSTDKLKASQEIIQKHKNNLEQNQNENNNEENEVNKLLNADDDDNTNKEITEEEKQIEEEQKGDDEHKIFLNQHSDIYLEEFDFNTFKQMVRH